MVLQIELLLLIMLLLMLLPLFYLLLLLQLLLLLFLLLLQILPFLFAAPPFVGGDIVGVGVVVVGSPATLDVAFAAVAVVLVASAVVAVVVASAAVLPCFLSLLLFPSLIFFLRHFIFSPFQVISRKELRPLRRALQREQSLRLCGKRIQLHCDPDGDQRVTQEEWEVCLGLKRHPASTAVRPSTSRAPPPSVARRAKDPSKRRGRNPLEKWLKQD